ncbi:MAG TPA: hypothetical protein DCO75_08595 [Fibrobacteres bacterium]|nr:hypothetical protein [Fibrobacterota bacterium]
MHYNVPTGNNLYYDLTMQKFNWDSGLLLSYRACPKTAVDYQQLLDANDMDGVEAALMERIESEPENIPFFLPAYKAFVKRRECDRAGAFLQLHIDCLEGKDELLPETQLLREILEIWPDCRQAHNKLLDHLRTIYCESPNLELFSRHLNIYETVAGIEPLRQLELWLRYDTNRIVYIPSKGAARVKETNPKIGVIRIVFGKGEQMTLRLDEAFRLAKSLSKEHFLTIKFDRPDELGFLAKSDPAGLLKLLFSSISDSIPLSELRDMLLGIIPETQWNSWWNLARKDPRLTVGSGAKAVVSWNATASGADSAILDIFEHASGYEKLDIYRKHASRSVELEGSMSRLLISEANASLDPDTSFSLEVILTLEKSSCNQDPALFFSPEDIIKRKNPVEVITHIKDRLIRKKAIGLIPDLHDDWQDIYAEFLRTETDIQIIGLIYDTLHDRGCAEICTEAIKRTISEPVYAPGFYLWFCKQTAIRPEFKQYLDKDFILPLLGIMEHSAFKGHHPALRKLFDSGEAADWAVVKLDAASGRSLLDALRRDKSLEDYRKERIRDELLVRFPEFRDKADVLYVTKEALEKKRIEFEKLIHEDIPHNTKEIQRTREYGDLRENFEYHAARHKQEMLSSRAKTLHDQLNTARIIDPSTVDISKVSVGTSILLRPADKDEEPVTLTILGPWDSDPAKNIMSYSSVAGALLLNAKPGDEVTFSEKKYFVDNIEVWNNLTM